MSQSKMARIEVFRPGTFTPMEGKALTFSAADLRAAADAYDPQTAPAPIVVGHPVTDTPAFGWVEQFDYDDDSERMSAVVKDIAPEFADAVRAGRYRKVSMAFYSPSHDANPAPGVWYPKHIGFLGGAAPAVPGLKNAAFSADQNGVAEFAMPLSGQHDLTALFGALSEFLLGRTVSVPQPRITWQVEAPAFRAGDAATPTPDTPQNKEPPVDKTNNDAAVAAKEAALTEREQALAERERQAANAENAAFAEQLVQAGKLIPASRDALTAILNELGATTAVFSVDGSTSLTPAAALRKLLSDQPKVVEFAQVKLGDDRAATVAFAADGKPVDSARLEILAKAEAYQAAHPGTDFIAAVKAVS